MSLRIAKKVLVPLKQEDQRHHMISADGDAWAKQEKLNAFGRFFNSIIEFPSDVLIRANEYIESLDWEHQGAKLGNVTGTTLVVFYFLVRFVQDNVLVPNKDKIRSSHEYFDLSRSETLLKYECFSDGLSSASHSDDNSSKWFDGYLTDINYLVEAMNLILIMINALISLKLFFFSYKKYSLFNLKNPPLSKNVILRPVAELYSVETPHELKTGALSRVWNFLTHSRSTTDYENPSTYYELSKWDPSPLLVSLFASYNPITFFFLYFNKTVLSSVVPIALLQMLFIVVVEKFTESEKDSQILATAMVQETTDKITHGYNLSIPTNRKIFITHSLSGGLIKEAYNYDKQEFEVL